jgi:allophanate hydrolase
VTANHRDITATLDAVDRLGARAVIDETLAALAEAPAGVLIGPPLDEVARVDAVRIDTSTEPLPLRGVPFLVKDNIDVADVPTTAACPGFAYVPRHDAPIVAALRRAGAIVVGKANLDQFATGLVGTRSPYGTPPNALDAALVPGGSSSGSAAAVAHGLVPFALGTDTAGSGRVPAALNGIVGLKPTVGRHDTSGIVPAVRRFDCPSVFARHLNDAVRVAAAMDPRHPHVSLPAASGRPIIGIAATWPATLDVDPAIDNAYREVVELLTGTGAVLRPIDLNPLLAVGDMLYGSAIVAERAITAGDAISRHVAGLDPHVAAVINAGTRYTAADAYRTEYELADRRRVAERLLANIDLLALPTTPIAPSLAEVTANPVTTNEMLGSTTTFANLLGLPAIVLPIPAPIPAGLQLLTHPWADNQLARFAIAAATEIAANHRAAPV